MWILPEKNWRHLLCKRMNQRDILLAILRGSICSVSVSKFFKSNLREELLRARRGFLF